MNDTPNLASYIDHTNLAVNASEGDIRLLCAEAVEHGFAAVCVNPIWVKLAADLLKDSKVKVCTVIGFPTGAQTAASKQVEAELALANGAQELDMVINIAALQAGNKEALSNDMAHLADIAHEHGAILKVILETALLSDEEIIRGCELSWEFGADFVKTSTGMLAAELSANGTTGASIHAVKLMASKARGSTNVGDPMGIKASGGIRDKATAIAMIDAGATRLGTSSGVAIVTANDDVKESAY